MALVAIKIGENEPVTYSRYNSLYKHLDIVSIHNKKGNGEPVTSLGRLGSKKMLGLNVDTTQFTDKEIHSIRQTVCSPYLADGIISLSGINSKDIIAQRLWHIDITKIPDISIDTINRINDQAGIRRNIRPKLYAWMITENLVCGEINLWHRHRIQEKEEEFLQDLDMRTVNRFDKVVPWRVFANAVINKRTNQTLLEYNG